VPGVQRAIVTGPRGKEVHTDAHGCVKVRFLWDRRAPLDDRSSGWVPVVHANDSMSIPHKDDWVLVAFPDLDHPIVIGTLANAARPLPHPHADHDRKGIWARSIGPGARQGYSEVSLGNQGGKELMRVRAQHDLNKTVIHDEVSTIFNDRNVTVHNHEFLNVMKGNLNMDVFQGSAMLRAKQGVLLESVGDSMLMRSGQSITVTAPKGITLTCGSSKIVMTPDAILIDSKKVVVKGPDGIELN
jgi:type VI secretion system secreted protein VgrG